ncbi:MAG TPA: NAD-dependent epimerase/dehydratase family protein [Candidatus Omnitrophota bacterium]|jgi:nucleoside-diphosphate-sugar epimerase|nr:NAD-dependent epimerase/dehydratase family protein [Candidatus Omnitrophota bacterium]HQB12354.1 NAD-dependent epimerase/dehydratase family protein [Candidatus Omnitrophota bacterium]
MTKIRCAVTGASGYLGSRLVSHLASWGIEVIQMTHSPSKVAGRSIQFSLGEEVMIESLRGLDALVHCAYDFSVTDWDDIVRKNVDGTRRLFVAAKATGIKTVFFVSSMSAFAGCRSFYGRAKLLGEQVAFETGAFVVRPGLIYDAQAGGMVGTLRRVIEKSSWVPVLRTRGQRLYLLHSKDFCQFILNAITGQICLPLSPVTLAHERGFTLDEIIRVIGLSMGKRLTLIPIPSGIVYVFFKTGEIFGIRGRLRSDAVRSMLNCDPSPSFLEMNTLNFIPQGFSEASFRR